MLEPPFVSIILEDVCTYSLHQYPLCCGLNENGLHKLLRLNVWSTLGRIERCGLVGGGMSLGGNFEVSKTQAFLVSSLFVLYL